MENVTLTPKEQMRVQVLNSLLAEQIALDQAAELMGVSTRHARRITTAYREDGAAALAHGHRGRKPVNATPEAVIADVVRLASTRYQGANQPHLSELLSEREGIHIGRTTLRRILLDAGLSSPRRRRPPKHRVRRQRMPRAGMLIQLGGSYHRWLGDHSPPFTLLLAVDDATGSVVDALFCQQEDSHNYFLLMQNLLQLSRGIPLARWDAVQKAKLEGMSIRQMARELGLHRDTVRRYIDVETPPMRRSSATLPASTSDTIPQ